MLASPRQLTDLPAATTLNSTDLFLVRQSNLDKQFSASIMFSTFLQSSNNLSDVQNPNVALNNLGGAAAGNVLLKANNLSDVSSASTARTNLGLAIGTNVEAWSANLDSLAANVTTGILCQSATNTVTARTLTPPAAGFAINNPQGVAGNPTFVLTNDLLALENLPSTGIAVRINVDTWAQRQLISSDNTIHYVNSNGAGGDIDLSVIQGNLNLNNIPGTVPISQGGTGQTTKAPAFDALAPTSARGDVIYRGASANQALSAAQYTRLFLSKGNAADPIFTQPYNVGGTVFLGYAQPAVDGGGNVIAYQWVQIDQTLNNLGFGSTPTYETSSVSLIIDVNGAQPLLVSPGTLLLQFGYGGASPTWFTSNYTWSSLSAASGSSPIVNGGVNNQSGWDICGGIQPLTTGFGGNIYSNIELSLGVGEALPGPQYPVSMNSKFSTFNTGGFLATGTVGGARSKYNGSQLVDVTALRLFLTTSNGISLASVASDPLFKQGTAALYAKLGPR